MRSSILALSVVAISAAVRPATGEIVEWPVGEGGNGHLYEAVLAPDTGITRFRADSIVSAEGDGWHLAVITTPEENEFVYSLFEGDPAYWEIVAGHTATGPILGGYHVGPTKYDYARVTGEPFVYAPWGPTAPAANGNVIAYFGYYNTYGTSYGNDIPAEYYWWISAYIRENPNSGTTATAKTSRGA